MKAVEPHQVSVARWNVSPRPVGRLFARADNKLVSIAEPDFGGDDVDMAARALELKRDSTMGLAALRAPLEHDIALNLVADQYPDAHEKAHA